MATNVYSHSFHRHTGTGPWTWVCPTGMTAVVKYIGGFNGSASAGQVVAKIGGDTVYVSSLPVNTGQYLGGLHIVFDEGETLTLLTTASSMSAVACGFLLRNVPGYSHTAEQLPAPDGAWRPEPKREHGG